MLSPGPQRDKRASPTSPSTYHPLTSQQSLLLAAPDTDASGDQSSITSSEKRVAFAEPPRPARGRAHRAASLQGRLREARRQSVPATSAAHIAPRPAAPRTKMPSVSVRDPTSVLGLGAKVVFSYLNGPGEGLVTIDTKKDTIVFLHPTAMNAHYYDLATGDPRLAGRYNLLSFDMPFHGNTTGFNPDPKQPYPVEATAKALCAALKKLGLGKNVHILAMAQFGIVALYALLEQPDMFLSFTWLGTVLQTEHKFCLDNFNEMYEACLEGDNGDMTRIPPAVIFGMLYAFCGEGFVMPKEMAEYWLSYWNAEYRPDRPLKIIKFFDLLINRKAIPEDKLKRIATRIHCLHGSDDFVNPPSGGILEGFAATVPRARVTKTIIPGASHWVMLHPDALTAAIGYWDAISHPRSPSVSPDALRHIEGFESDVIGDADTSRSDGASRLQGSQIVRA